jgi:hypothetical protein
MLKTLLIRQSERQEYYTVDINGKVIHVYIEKGDDGAVFTIEDHGVYLLDGERVSVLEELKTLSIDFSSRRIDSNLSIRISSPTCISWKTCQSRSITFITVD